MASALGCSSADFWECEEDVIQSLVYGSTFLELMARQVGKSGLCKDSVAKRGECASRV